MNSRAGAGALWGVKILAGVLATGGTVFFFFSLAGRWDWVEGWVCLGLLTCGQSASGLYLWHRNPELIRRRGSVGKDTKAWDKACLSLFGLTYMGILVVGALDERLGWSEAPVWLVPVGAGLYVLDAVVITWAMAVNQYFEKTARIQVGRGHKVVDSGPYKLLRHPGYAATIPGFILAPPLMLGSLWAFLPAGAAVANLILRTALEDRMLKKELPGYAEYARRVRYRLLPGVW